MSEQIYDQVGRLLEDQGHMLSHIADLESDLAWHKETLSHANALVMPGEMDTTDGYMGILIALMHERDALLRIFQIAQALIDPIMIVKGRGKDNLTLSQALFNDLERAVKAFEKRKQ